MRTAYGLQIPGENVSLTHVEQGSPMGELMRRYWQPIALSADLAGRPKKTKILCEEVVLFRDKKGRVGAP